MDFDGFEEQAERDFAGTGQPLRRLLRRAQRAYTERNYESARRILEALSRAVPDSTIILYPLACVLFRMDQFHESLRLCNRLDRLGDTRSRLLRGQLDVIRAQDPAAWEQFNELELVTPHSTETARSHRRRHSPLAHVHISGPPEDTLAFMRVARLHEIGFAFTDEMASDVAPIQITDEMNSALVCVDRACGICISTYQREGICMYTGLDNGSYLMLCALLGVTQWRTLEMNPLLVAEDFHHGPACRCLFSHQICKEDFALVLEDPEVCTSCLAFYRCLGVEREVDTLTDFLNSFRTSLSPFDSSSFA